MTSYLASTRDFLYNRRKPFVVVGGVIGGLYMVANYAISKLTEVQTRMMEERRDRENLRRRFTQNQEDCNFTILALLPTLGDQLFSNMDVEGLTAKLQRGRQSPAAHEPSITTIKQEAPAANGHAVAAIEGSDNVDQVDSSQAAMEEIWSKLGPTTGSISNEGEDEHSKDSGVEMPTTNGDVMNNEGIASLVEETTQPTISAEKSAPSVPESTSISSALDAFSEPAPLPIPSDARLAPSPSQTPNAEGNGSALESEKAEEEVTTVASLATESALASVPANNSVISEGEREPEASSSSGRQAQVKEPSPEEVLAEKKEKLALWNELKITAFSRTVTTLYGLVLLSLQTHIQLNLLGRYAYLTSVASLSAPASLSNHRIRLERHDGHHYDADEEEEEAAAAREESLEDSKGVDVQTERLYLTFSWWFLHQGWKQLAEEVKEAVEDVFGGLPLKSQLTHQDFLLLLNKVRRRVEYEPRDELASSTVDARSEWSEATAATSRRRGNRKTFLSVLFPPSSEEVSVLERAGAIPNDPSIKNTSDISANLSTLLDETKDLLESKDFARILRLCLNRVFEVFEGTLRPTFGVEPALTSSEVDGLLRQSELAVGREEFKNSSSSNNINGRFQQLTDDGQAGIRVRLASLFPAVARQSSAAINGVPNEYVEAITDIKEFKAFSAVIYSSWM